MEREAGSVPFVKGTLHHTMLPNYIIGLHKTKWGCTYCNSFLTSQHNLDLHIQNVHVDQNYACLLCNVVLPVTRRVFFKTHGEIHMAQHKRYKRAYKNGLV